DRSGYRCWCCGIALPAAYLPRIPWRAPILNGVTPTRARQLLRALWLLAILIVIVGSLLPGDSSPMRALDRLHISDKIEHMAAYTVLALLPALHERRG